MQFGTQSHRPTPAPVRAPSLPHELVVEVQLHVLVLLGTACLGYSGYTQSLGFFICTRGR